MHLKPARRLTEFFSSYAPPLRSISTHVGANLLPPVVQDCACLVPAYSFKSLYGTPRKLHAATKTTRKLANTDVAPRLRPLRSAPAVASKPLHSSGTARCRSTRCALVSTDNDGKPLTSLHRSYDA